MLIHDLNQEFLAGSSILFIFAGLIKEGKVITFKKIYN
jgi:hypothetical protein